MAIENRSNKDFEIEIPQLKPLGIKLTREIRRRQKEEQIRKSFGVNKTKTAVAAIV